MLYNESETLSVRRKSSLARVGERGSHKEQPASDLIIQQTELSTIKIPSPLCWLQVIVSIVQKQKPSSLSCYYICEKLGNSFGQYTWGRLGFIRGETLQCNVWGICSKSCCISHKVCLFLCNQRKHKSVYIRDCQNTKWHDDFQTSQHVSTLPLDFDIPWVFISCPLGATLLYISKQWNLHPIFEQQHVLLASPI